MSDNLFNAEQLSEEIRDRIQHDDRIKAIERYIKVEDELQNSIIVGAIMETFKRIQTEALERLIVISPEDRGAIAKAQAVATVVNELQQTLRLIMQMGIAANIALRDEAPIHEGSIVGDH